MVERTSVKLARSISIQNLKPAFYLLSKGTIKDMKRVHTHTRARTHAHTHIHTHARTHARTHTHTHTCTHMHTHTHARTHARTHTPVELTFSGSASSLPPPSLLCGWRFNN